MEHHSDLSTYEAQRLQRIGDLCLGDTDPDDTLDRIIALTAAYFRAPIAMISVVGEHQQWFRAKLGLVIEQTPRSTSFCAHTLLTHAFLEVPDAWVDHRFNTNPLVLAEPNIRYYAGAPLTTEDGLGLGTLCVIDTVARPAMSERDVSMLEHFAGLVLARIHAMRSTHYIDATTGLPNRSKFAEDIGKALTTKADRRIVAIDTLSPSFLNQIVTTLGHDFSLSLMGAVKDRLLAIIGGRAPLYCLGPTRYGLLSDAKEGDVALFGDIIKAFQAPVITHDIPLQLTPGLGLLSLPSQDVSAQECIRLAVSAADEAREKTLGCKYYEKRLDTAQQRTFTILHSLMAAMQSDSQLRLVYQPRVDIHTGACTAVEALLRWDHPSLGAIGPAEFIPLAEKTSLMSLLSLWVLRAVTSQAAQWHRRGLNIHVSMNISASDLETPVFTDTLLELVEQGHAAPGLLEFELTETARIVDPDQVVQQLHRIREVGATVALDDFGTGYSNWSYLQQLPASVVKLDRSLIEDLAHQPKNQCLVRSLIQLANSLDYQVVAEGIETVEVLRLVRLWGCAQAQGYLIARPLEADALPIWLTTRGTAQQFG